MAKKDILIVAVIALCAAVPYMHSGKDIEQTCDCPPIPGICHKSDTCSVRTKPKVSFGNLEPAKSAYGETCTLCGSARFSGQLIYKSPVFATCRHRWRKGLGGMADSQIKPGTIVLVTDGRKYGAFYLLPGKGNPYRSMTFYKIGGKGYFRASEGTESISRKSERKSLENIFVGPFLIEIEHWPTGWSTLYYPNCGALEWGYSYSRKAANINIRVCITNETDISKINAADPCWIYKGFPGDSGWRHDKHGILHRIPMHFKRNLGLSLITSSEKGS